MWDDSFYFIFEKSMPKISVHPLNYGAAYGYEIESLKTSKREEKKLFQLWLDMVE